jgi:hypothetical protein
MQIGRVFGRPVASILGIHMARKMKPCLITHEIQRRVEFTIHSLFKKPLAIHFSLSAGRNSWTQETRQSSKCRDRSTRQDVRLRSDCWDNFLTDFFGLAKILYWVFATASKVRTEGRRLRLAYKTEPIAPHFAIKSWTVLLAGILASGKCSWKISRV